MRELIAVERIEFGVRIGDVIEITVHEAGEPFEVDAEEAQRLVRIGAARAYADAPVEDGSDEDEVDDEDAEQADEAAAVAEPAQEPVKPTRSRKKDSAAPANPSIVDE